VENLESAKGIGKEVLENIKFSNTTGPTTLPPVVCIPGVGGSQLSARIGRPNAPHWYCKSNSDWYLVWLTLMDLIPGPILDCWSYNIMLNYTNSTGQFSNSTGVDVMANYFGTTVGFEYLDPTVPSQTIYFAAVVESLVAVGYKRGVNLFGAPYDWRYSPNYLPYYFQALKQMIEDAYTTNGDTRVAVIAHSMGNLFFLTFLRTVSQEWKDRYILTYMATSPPWVGAVEAVQSLTSGYDFSIPYLPPSSAKIIQQTFASNYFLLPYPKYYGSNVFVQTPKKNYTALNYDDLLSDLGIPQMYDPWIRSLHLANPYEPPGVNTYCLYGYNVTTLHQEIFSSNDFTKRPTLVNGDGDGTVPIESLIFCNNWAGKSNFSLSVKGYAGQEHVDLLLYTPFLADLVNGILNATNPKF